LLMRRGAKGAERLPGVRVLVTRPAPAATRLADAFAAEGAVVHRVPALAIVPVVDRESVDRLRRRLPDVCAIVFTSVNAVKGFFGEAPGATPIRPPTPDSKLDRLSTPGATPDWLSTPDAAPDRRLATVLAVGPATAEALRARGVVDVRTPSGRFDSEGLLACPPLAVRRVAGRLVAVVKGEGGRDLLGKALVRRGAEVVEANVYRRRAPERLAEMLEAVRDSVDIVTVTSAEALGNLVDAAPWIASWLSDRMLITVSERVAGIARARGLSRVAVAAGADAASIVDAAARAVAEPGETGPGGAEPGETGPGGAEPGGVGLAVADPDPGADSG